MLTIHDFKIGMLVRMIAEHPRHGMGVIRQYDLGIIVEIKAHRNEMYVLFGRQTGWCGIPSDFEIIRQPFTVEVGMQVKTIHAIGTMGLSNIGELVDVDGDTAHVKLKNRSSIQKIRFDYLYPAVVSNRASKNTLHKL